MELIGDNDRWFAEQGVEWVCDFKFEPQTPGIMRLLRTAAARAPPSSTH